MYKSPGAPGSGKSLINSLFIGATLIPGISRNKVRLLESGLV